MAKKIFSSIPIKVENMSGFDKSRLNALTSFVGTITPIAKQLLLPGNFHLSVDLNAVLPPLAFDTYLRSHLKVEAFTVPMRLCYGGFESWFCGKEMYNAASDSFVRAKLPRIFYSQYYDESAADSILPDNVPSRRSHGGACSLLDYLGFKPYLSPNGVYPTAPGAGEVGNSWEVGPIVPTLDSGIAYGEYLSIFPIMAYHLIYDEWYRNKLVQKPLFAPIDSFDSFSRENLKVAHLPFSCFKDIKTIVDRFDYFWNWDDGGADNFRETCLSDKLLDGSSILDLHQRNYGDDYFTVAQPTAQEGDPSVVSTAGGSFTISALRLQNAMQEFKEANNYASPDYIQTCSVRYGVAPSAGIAQKPILVGSADFPFFTNGVSNQAGYEDAVNQNPMGNLIGSKSGSASANGTQFVCEGYVTEPSYLMVLCTFVPEANYAYGIDHDLRLFIKEGSLVDLPVGALEHVGNEPIFVSELSTIGDERDIFGYVQRYLWHKAGNHNEIHGLYRKGLSLQSAFPQREFDEGVSSPSDIQISSDFLKINTSDLDNVTSVKSQLSQYGIRLDAFIQLRVSEPLTESALPSLSNPAIEHGRTVYVHAGGSKLD